MSSSPERIGYEFSRRVKDIVKARKQCEYPIEPPCYNLITTVDHLTGILLGKMLGMNRKTIKSLGNAQGLCLEHNQVKTNQEVEFLIRMERKRGFSLRRGAILRESA